MKLKSRKKNCWHNNVHKMLGSKKVNSSCSIHCSCIIVGYWIDEEKLMSAVPKHLPGCNKSETWSMVVKIVGSFHWDINLHGCKKWVGFHWDINLHGCKIVGWFSLGHKLTWL